MGGSMSQDGYKPIVTRVAKELRMSEEVLNEIYNRFSQINGGNEIEIKDFLKIFPFVMEQTSKNLLNYLGIQENEKVTFNVFSRLFLSLNPSLSSQHFTNLLWGIFSKDNAEFDFNLFEQELRSSNLYISGKTDRELHEMIKESNNIVVERKIQQIKIENETATKINIINKDKFDIMMKDQKSPLYTYGKELVFSSSVFR